MAAEFPKTVLVRQEFERPVIPAVADTVRRQLAGLDLGRTIRPGHSVAITAGSRGICRIAEITREVVRHVQSLDARPFIVPAMGSHGGATADGQRQLLARLGVTEEFCQCPIRTATETTVIGQSRWGFDIHVDRLALAADHVLLVNRIKPHTSIAGELESGLIKMLLVGLGNSPGAAIFHQALANVSFADIASDIAESTLRRCHVCAALGIVENAYDEIAVIEAMHPADIMRRERELLRRAKQWMGSLPFADIDVLLVDEIGKDISGTGMDTNVIGRKSNDHQAAPGEMPRVKRICVRALSEKTSGNALGIGLAEFCHDRVLQQLDRQATNINCLTANHPTAGMLPLAFASDREMLSAAFATIGWVPSEQAKFVWIKNTLELTEFICSDTLQVARELQVVRELGEMRFDAAGNLKRPTPDD